MVSFAKLLFVLAAGCPATELALSRIQIAKLRNETSVATSRLRYQVAAPGICDPSRLFLE